MKDARWVDFTLQTKKKYKAKKTPILDAERLAIRLNEYFDDHTKYNIYSLGLYLGCSEQRFVRQYLKSNDKDIRELAQMAMSLIASHALDNSEDYRLSLRYIIQRMNIQTSDLIELDETVQNDNQSQIIILPSKD